MCLGAAPHCSETDGLREGHHALLGGCQNSGLLVYCTCTWAQCILLPKKKFFGGEKGLETKSLQSLFPPDAVWQGLRGHAGFKEREAGVCHPF